MDGIQFGGIVTIVACVAAQNIQGVMCILLAKTTSEHLPSPAIASFFSRYRAVTHQWLKKIITSHPTSHIRKQAACILYFDQVSRVLPFVALGLTIAYSVFCT